MASAHTRPVWVGYQLFMLILCLYALAALALQTAIRVKPETQAVLDYADYGVCTLFFLDFIISLWRAQNRSRYFATWGWLDLLSSIPTLDVVRWGRAARVLRIFRVVRGLRATKVVAELVLRRRAANTFLAASLIALLLIIFCSVAVLHFEVAPESNIKTADDAIWWAFETTTLVGYGDHYPVTSEGRFVAAILMSAGIGLFGTFSGFLAAWFIGSDAAEGTDVSAEIGALRRDVAALRKSLGHVGQDETA